MSIFGNTTKRVKVRSTSDEAQNIRYLMIQVETQKNKTKKRQYCINYFCAI